MRDPSCSGTTFTHDLLKILVYSPQFLHETALYAFTNIVQTECAQVMRRCF